MIRNVLLASRPISWINTAYPFAAGYLMIVGSIDARLVVGTLFFLIPYNLLMYGINDIFDYESDLANPRKGGIEGGVSARSEARRVHRAIVWTSIILAVPGFAWLVVQGSPAAGVTLTLVVFGVLAYSLPGLRFKERPFVDSLTSALHFAGPLMYAVVLTSESLVSRSMWPIVAAFVAWGMASHAFGAIQDVRADRSAGIGSVATVVGAGATARMATGLYILAGAFLFVAPWPAPLAAILTIPYAWNVARFWSVTDDDCERANAGWRTFLWLNQPVGFALTMVLIAAARDWL